MKTAHGLSIPETLEEVCDPHRVALLVYDMQVGILSQIKNPEQITRPVVKVLNAARDAGVRIFFSRHLSLPKELMGMFQFRMAMAWQRVDSPEKVTPWFFARRSWVSNRAGIGTASDRRCLRQIDYVGLRRHVARFRFARLRHQRLYHRRRSD